MNILITGGAGFIGSAVIRQYLEETDHTIINVDALTYAGNLDSLTSVSDHSRYHFELVNICDRQALEAVFDKHQPDAVMHLAAESHVDRSIDGPGDFIQTNIIGSYQLLEVTLAYWRKLSGSQQQDFRFHHISTDEVYGSLGPTELFTEQTAYQPNSPYSASKASSDHLVRSWHHTYQLPVVTTNCSNNYGPYQFPEKLIPLMILNALEGKPLPVYGKGDNIRDWLYVDDHARALRLVLERGAIGETYNIGGHNEKTNLEVIDSLCSILDQRLPNAPCRPHRELVEFVSDRPGHDQRYAINASKIQRELGWVPQQSFATGIELTVDWYLTNRHWWQAVLDGSYRRQRLGTNTTTPQGVHHA